MIDSEHGQYRNCMTCITVQINSTSVNNETGWCSGILNKWNNSFYSLLIRYTFLWRAKFHISLILRCINLWMCDILE